MVNEAENDEACGSSFHPCHYSRMAGWSGFKGCLKSSPFKVSFCLCLGSSGHYVIHSAALGGWNSASISLHSCSDELE